MKILFTLTRSVNPLKGGVQRITYNLGQYFAAQGMQVYFYSLQHDDHIDITFAKVFHFPTSGGINVQINLEHFKGSIEKIRPDIVINQMPYVSQLRSLLFEYKRRYNFRIFSCIHNSLFNYKDNIGVYLRRNKVIRSLPNPILNIAALIQRLLHRIKHGRELREIINMSDFLVLYTPLNIEELRYFVGNYKSEKVTYIPNPVNMTFAECKEKEKLIVHVGTINVQQKRSDLLADFWAKVYKALPDWQFIIVGDGPYFKELKRDFQNRNLERFSFTGRVVPELYYQAASFFMMPSAYEGFPNTIIEAQSCSCPVLAFNSYPALEWIVNNERDALLSSPYDTSQMAEHAIAIARSPEKLNQMQVAAKANAKRFSIEKVGQEWIKHFNDIAS